MLKNISIYISAYLEKEQDYILLHSLIPKNIEATLINDNPNFKIKNFKNNEENFGKFYSIMRQIKHDEKKFMIIIDPDDILLNNINWETLFELDINLHNIGDPGIIINSYYIRKSEHSKFRFVKNPRNIFNPCTIYNLKNLKKHVNDFNNRNYINYMDDLCFALISIHNNWTIQKIDFPFYKYSYISGMSTMDKSLYSLDLKNASYIEKKFNLKVNSLITFYIWFLRIIRLRRLKNKYGK